ncbi:hypothetical protein E4P42_04100 [Mycobacterium sp. PS03-16]|uniref:DoxX family protein n=1 Tax=Mycobacterium sp. PS03-16 TaxID=2559611 RepID=UPI001073A75C|nr:DoxX family protein [Mycobacterium sp. PS03-16]TFV60674.1 hypothetical protein E4P42_04100 [Mycobacterium sp. PS03-16]
MSTVTSARAYGLLAAVQVGDAVACAIPLGVIEKAFDDVRLAPELRPLIPVVKVASALGLLSVFRYPKLARLTTFMLTVYFVLAVTFHLRARDYSPGLVAASSFLALYATMTAKGPSLSPR